MNRVLASLAVAALTSVAVPAAAETTVATPGVREHDGFFAQIQAGPAFLSLSEDSTDMTLDGPGFGLAVAIGGSPVRNLVLFGEVISQAAVAPTLELGGEEIESDDSVTLSFTSIGPGAAYYFGASNFFVSGSLGLATATLDYEEGSGEASGIGLRLGVGKEWWIGDQWGLGVGANLFAASLEDEDDFEYSATSFALSFSATFQ